ncbi:MAG TPA: hypothetical protein VNO81_13940 [Candidatus Nitrosotenuis sp.]|nr:hypothetical protein [Candidatus Nitrosotenuis sp.]
MDASTFTWDRIDRATSIIRVADTTTLSDDGAGNLTSRTDPRGQTITHACDAANRPDRQGLPGRGHGDVYS